MSNVKYSRSYEGHSYYNWQSVYILSTKQINCSRYRSYQLKECQRSNTQGHMKVTAITIDSQFIYAIVIQIVQPKSLSNPEQISNNIDFNSVKSHDCKHLPLLNLLFVSPQNCTRAIYLPSSIAKNCAL